ncbi:hypothetical protein MPTK1_5g07070 [Marchantia polymorpha subsp. ruderalis]|uniref:Uncharacterized protein n=2 Tax=Marchantia polymorpha TaxID=3197 RepID=A0AAF6BFT0_MARPO|nr:hypothetical protein MARPO_0136s0014 [Marchantia polymorpha]BBN10864.1 hypothetical protein Mp_5g07070 [Marchantia polymorpha subsp. ruderalis]|eukprot:PTQ29686.1 hypothetical protein MARPO_0136s0014 [Marchantia polymorpha]
MGNRRDVELRQQYNTCPDVHELTEEKFLNSIRRGVKRDEKNVEKVQTRKIFPRADIGRLTRGTKRERGREGDGGGNGDADADANADAKLVHCSGPDRTFDKTVTFSRWGKRVKRRHGDDGKQCSLKREAYPRAELRIPQESEKLTAMNVWLVSRPPR